MTMKFHFSWHVLEELENRQIPQKLVERVLYAPEQKVPEVDDVTCYQIKWRPAVTSCRPCVSSTVEVDSSRMLVRETGSER